MIDDRLRESQRERGGETAYLGLGRGGRAETVAKKSYEFIMGGCCTTGVSVDSVPEPTDEPEADSPTPASKRGRASTVDDLAGASDEWLDEAASLAAAVAAEGGGGSGGGALFSWAPGAPCHVSCRTCHERLSTFFKVEDGHVWDGQAAAIFACVDESVLRIDVERSVSMYQGIGRVSDVHCGACDHRLGWKLVESPVASQTGKVGFMLPQVTLTLADDPERAALSLPPATDELDELALRFMTHHGILGMSAAWVLSPGRAPFARSWGWSSLDVHGRGIALTPATPLRVASVSKPLTAVAVLQLVERGKVSLDEKVLPRIGLAEAQLRDGRAANITVRHLLHHVCGGWTNTPRCPMFQEWGLSRAELIERTLRDCPLEHEPGERYGYSNFGYCLLGRLIEALSGLSYESYVRAEVLGRCGIEGDAYVEDGRAAATTRYFVHAAAPEDPAKERQRPRRVDLRSSAVAEADALVGRMDSHGGWVLSPSALVLFSQALDSPGVLLNEASLKLLTTPLAESAGYAMGWSTNTHARWHSGNLEGTAAILVRTSQQGGMHWALVSNTGSVCHTSKAELDPFGWECLEAVRKCQ